MENEMEKQEGWERTIASLSRLKKLYEADENVNLNLNYTFSQTSNEK